MSHAVLWDDAPLSPYFYWPHIRWEKEDMSKLDSVVAVYETHVQAEQAVRELQEAGVDMKSLSIAAKDTHTDEHVVGYYTRAIE